MPNSDEQTPYRVKPDGRQFQVLDEDGHVVFVCGNAANAEQYMVVMNEAYRRGYRAGVRGRRDGRPGGLS